MKGQAETRLCGEDKSSEMDGIKLHGREVPREPNAENPPVRFEEGGHSSNCAAAASTLPVKGWNLTLILIFHLLSAVVVACA